MIADRETEYVDYTDTHWGYHARGAVGLQIFVSSLFGFTGELGYAYAPVVDNDIGDVHDSGGTTIFLGMHGRIEGFL